ncbi:Pumilio-like 12, partial [Mucuna pruriens]
MAQQKKDSPYRLRQVQNPTVVESRVLLRSVNLQHFSVGRFYRGESSSSGVQGLVFNPYIHDYGSDMRITRAANAPATIHVQQHHHHLIGGSEQSGRWALLAKDRDGSRIFARKIDRATPQEIDMILQDLRYYWHELIKHPFGKHVVLKFFQSSNITMSQMNTIILQFIIMDEQKLKDVCTHYHGYEIYTLLFNFHIELNFINWVIQTMLKELKDRNMQRYALAIIYAIKPISVALMKNVNGGYVLQHCLKLFPSECPKVFLDEVVKNFVDIARDNSGCRVIQDYMRVVEGEVLQQLAFEIISNVAVLAQDPYGNYVVQLLAKMQIMQVNAMLISQLRYTYVRLSMNKYASNVVQILLQYSEMKYAAVIVLELLCSLECVVLDCYGNYVVQSALKCTQ